MNFKLKTKQNKPTKTPTKPKKLCFISLWFVSLSVPRTCLHCHELSLWSAWTAGFSAALCQLAMPMLTEKGGFVGCLLPFLAILQSFFLYKPKDLLLWIKPEFVTYLQRRERKGGGKEERFPSSLQQSSM